MTTPAHSRFMALASASFDSVIGRKRARIDAIPTIRPGFFPRTPRFDFAGVHDSSCRLEFTIHHARWSSRSIVPAGVHDSSCPLEFTIHRAGWSSRSIMPAGVHDSSCPRPPTHEASDAGIQFPRTRTTRPAHFQDRTRKPLAKPPASACSTPKKAKCGTAAAAPRKPDTHASGDHRIHSPRRETPANCDGSRSFAHRIARIAPLPAPIRPPTPRSPAG